MGDDFLSKKQAKSGKQPIVAPSAEPFYGQPTTAEDIVNKYGTYNIQTTADTDDFFPAIANGLPQSGLSDGKRTEKQQKSDL